MIIIKWVLLNIALLISVLSYSQSWNKVYLAPTSGTGRSMRSVLEDIKSKTSFNFIYSDNLVNNLIVTDKIEDKYSENSIKKLLNKYFIGYRIYSGNSYVLFKKLPAPEKEEAPKPLVIKQSIPAFIDSIDIVTIPKMISKVNLVYPSEAVEQNIEGKLMVKFLVDEKGDVAETKIIQSSGSRILDSAAIAYLNSSKYIPAMKNGNPKSYWLSLVFKYLIR